MESTIEGEKCIHGTSSARRLGLEDRLEFLDLALRRELGGSAARSPSMSARASRMSRMRPIEIGLDNDPFTWNDLDHALGAKLLQSLVNGRPSQAQHFGNGALVKVLARQERQRDDAVLDLLIGTVGQRRPAAPRAHVGDASRRMRSGNNRLAARAPPTAGILVRPLHHGTLSPL